MKLARRAVAVAVSAGVLLMGGTVAQAAVYAGGLKQSAGPEGCFDAYNSVMPPCNTSTTKALSRATSLSVTQNGEFVYAASNNNGAVVTFRRSAQTGGLTEVAGPDGCIAAASANKVPLTCARTAGDELQGVLDVAVSTTPSSRSVFAVTRGSVVAFKRDLATGGLSEVNCLSDEAALANCGALRPFRNGNGDAPFGPVAVTTDPSGQYVYVASDDGGSDGSISAFKVENDGSLSQLPNQQACIANGANSSAEVKANCTLVNSVHSVKDLAVSPDGRNLYAISGGSANTITAFKRNGDGSLVPLDPGGAGECIDNDGKNTVNYCSVSAVGGFGRPTAVTVSPNGKEVFVSSAELNSIVSFKRDADVNSPTFGQLTELPPDSNGCWSSGAGGVVAVHCQVAKGIDYPTGLAASKDGYLYVSSANSSTVASFKVSDADATIEQLPQPDSCIKTQGSNAVCQTTGRAMHNLGSVLITEDQRHVYTVGDDRFFEWGNGGGGEVGGPIVDISPSVTGQLAVFSRASAPVCVDRQASVQAGQKVTIQLECTDADDDPFTLTVPSGPQRGSLDPIDQPAQTVEYKADAGGPCDNSNVPPNGFVVRSYTETFKYRANDGANNSNDATVTLEITCPEVPAPDPGANDSPPSKQSSGEPTAPVVTNATPATSQGATETRTRGSSKPARCSLVATLSSVSRWKSLGASTAVRLRTVSGGTYIHSRKKGIITLDHRGIGGKSSAVKWAVLSIDGKRVGKASAANPVKAVRFAIDPSKLSVGNHVALVKVVAKRSGKVVQVRRTFSVRDCRPTRFTASLSSLLRRAHPNLRLWVHTDGAALEGAKFQLARQVRISRARLKTLRGKVIGSLVTKADGRATTTKLIAPQRLSGRTAILSDKLVLSLGSSPALTLKNIPANTSELVVKLKGTKTGLMRNVDRCAALQYRADLVDTTRAKLTLKRTRKLCSNRR